MALDALNYLPREAFMVPNTEKWKVQPMRSPSLALMVIYEVPTDLEDHCMEMFLKQGTGELVKEEDQECFKKLKMHRLSVWPSANVLEWNKGRGIPQHCKLCDLVVCPSCPTSPIVLL